MLYDAQHQSLGWLGVADQTDENGPSQVYAINGATGGNQHRPGADPLQGLSIDLITRRRGANGSRVDVTAKSFAIGTAGRAWTANFGGTPGNVVPVRTHTAGRSLALSEVEVFERFDEMRPMTDASVLYEQELGSHCLNSQVGVGGGYNNYNGYKQCLSERSLNFDPTTSEWIRGVRDYCVSSQIAIGGGYNNYRGYQQCLSERSVTFVPDAEWCAGVRSYCEAQWYPFGGKQQCYWERGCSY